jgi:transcription antitermination factor NusG
VFLAEKDMWSALDALSEFATPDFSLMHSYGEIVKIKDTDLASLRKVSDVKPTEKNPVVWPQVGEYRRVTSGAFTGMTGLVKGKTKNHCLVEFESSRFPVVKIPPFLLGSIEA